MRTIPWGFSIFFLHLMSGKFRWVKAALHPWDAINRVPYNVVYPILICGMLSISRLLPFFISLWIRITNLFRNIPSKRCTMSAGAIY